MEIPSHFNFMSGKNFTTYLTAYRDALKDVLLKKSIRIGEFTLTSGRKSNFYIDARQTALSPDGATLIGELMFDMIVENQVQSKTAVIGAVAGMTMGADPIVTAISMIGYRYAHNIPALIVRKEPKSHGTNNYIEGLMNIAPGTSVCVVDDVATSGGSLLKTIERVEAHGLTVSLVLVIVDRQEGAVEALKELGYELKALFTKSDFVTE